ncbi:TonB-dependent receptor [Sphingomonas sp. MM-1]|uniref:TonB-dependent receptor n=1 Tax=Sphingomonas sp. MM-1 TaxID=745310 RepID=UPI0002C09310|nr:TonB-dependent receptor [Sphingomonas sp. MM-1]AGH50881.1 TonB-dependent receptor [Sphingomonas sp. MM-1]
MRFKPITSCLFLTTAFVPIAALHAEAVEPGDEIVVTALKRETSLQETPAAITALGGATLRAANIDNINDLQRTTPGLVITDAGPGQRRVALRGIRSAGDAQVGIYYDEAPLAGPPGTTTDAGGAASDIKLFDVERVEVLRGPQGTLYGAGAMGGALRVIFNKPDLDSFGASFDVSGTTTSHGGEGYQLNAAINVPIVTDRIGLRVVGYRRFDPGWIDNPKLGLKGVNKEDSDGGRILLRIKPIDDLTIDASAFYQDSKGSPSLWSPSVGKWQSPNLAVLPFRDQNRLYSLTARGELGFATLVATTSYQDRDLLMTRDPSYLWKLLGGQSYPAGLYYQPQNVTDWTSEIRLQSAGSGPFQWTVGGFYEDRKAKVLSEAHQVDPATGEDKDPPTVLLQRHVGDKLKQKALFGELAYTLFDRLTLTGGLRYYQYDKLVSGDTTIGFPLLGTPAAPYAEFASDNNGWLYKINIAYKLNDNVLIYGQAASGYRPGGVNQVLGLAAALPYLPDKLWTYEGGIKLSLVDRRLLINLTAYRTDWDNLQVTLDSGSFAYLGNAGAARAKGVEAELVLNPVPGLSFSANANLLSAKLTKDLIAPGTVPSATTGRAGDRIPNIPEGSFTLAGQYEWDLSNALTGLVRADFNHVGKFYSDFRPNPARPFNYREGGDYQLVNGRIGVRTQEWGAYLFVNNLLNKVARTSAGNVLGGSVEVISTVPPRTIGINLTGNF